MVALSLRHLDEVAELRGLSINQVLGLTGEKRLCDDSAAAESNGAANGVAAEAEPPADAAAED